VPSSFQGTPSGVNVTLGAGNFTVQPSAVSGFNATLSGNCQGLLLQDKINLAP